MAVGEGIPIGRGPERKKGCSTEGGEHERPWRETKTQVIHGGVGSRLTKKKRQKDHDERGEEKQGIPHGEEQSREVLCTHGGFHHYIYLSRKSLPTYGALGRVHQSTLSASLYYLHLILIRGDDLGRD